MIPRAAMPKKAVALREARGEVLAGHRCGEKIQSGGRATGISRRK